MSNRVAPLLVGLLALLAGAPPSAGRAGAEAKEDPLPVSSQTSRRPTPITFEEVATRPLPGTTAPAQIAFSPDDALITFLLSADHTLAQQLYAFDPATGERRPIVDPPGGGDSEANLSPEEKLRRERQRMMSVGVTRYAWSKKGGQLLVPLTGDIRVKDGVDGELRMLVDASSAPALDPRFSPDGSHIAYVQDDELYVVPVKGGASRQVTSGVRGTGKTNGLAEFVAQEEMDRDHGYWWSRDSRQLAFVEVDETHIPAYRIMHQGKSAVGGEAQEDHRYPFAGAANARVRLGVVPATGGKPVWMDLGDDDDIYLARVEWMPDGRLAAQVQNRAQTALDLVMFDPVTGRGTVVVEERTDVWINLDHSFHPLESSGELHDGFVWLSERTGYRHLYLYGADGTLRRQLTSGEWMVDKLVEVDEVGGKAYFLATKDGVTERHGYEVALAGGEPRRLTAAPGWHDIVIDHGFERFVDLHEALDKPPTATLRALADGARLATVHDETDPRLAQLALTPPRLATFESRDGETLHAALYEPPDAARPWRTMVAVYGGPQAQTVKNAWAMTADLRVQRLRSQGILVLRVDNRGSARRGLAFEGAIKHDMGNLEVRDQVDGVEWAIAQGLAHRGRVGMIGWSYGGYMAAMSLARAPDTFKLGVAGAPVTAWDGYDTHYTERYMGTPASNPDGYARSSVMSHADALRGKLLLVHGLLDENVHFRHTARLINALIARRADYDLLLFPDERHSPRRLEDRVFMEQRVFGFIDEDL